MTEAAVIRIDKARRPWRDKVSVLCFFEAIGKENGSTITYTDSIMIKVEFSDQIEKTFEKEMQKKIYSGTWSIGPKPIEWHLLRYITSNGKQRF